MLTILLSTMAMAAEVKLEIPPFWDDERKIMVEQPFLMVNQKGRVETCALEAGTVEILNEKPSGVEFRVKGGSGCGLVVMDREEFAALSPARVKKTREGLKKRQDEFRAQLDEDLSRVLRSRGESCLPPGKGLEMGKVYRLNGRLYRYHEGTEARELKGDACQVESGSLVEMVGFDRTGEFAVAVFRRPEGSKGLVPFGPKNEPRKVCAEDSRVVLPVSKLRNYFAFDSASTAEALSVTGLMALFQEVPRSCDPSEIGMDAAVNRSRKEKSAVSTGPGKAGPSREISAE